MRLLIGLLIAAFLAFSGTAQAYVPVDSGNNFMPSSVSMEWNAPNISISPAALPQTSFMQNLVDSANSLYQDFNLGNLDPSSDFGLPQNIIDFLNDTFNNLAGGIFSDQTVQTLLGMAQAPGISENTQQMFLTAAITISAVSPMVTDETRQEVIDTTLSLLGDSDISQDTKFSYMIALDGMVRFSPFASEDSRASIVQGYENLALTSGEVNIRQAAIIILTNLVDNGEGTLFVNQELKSGIETWLADNNIHMNDGREAIEAEFGVMIYDLDGRALQPEELAMIREVLSNTPAEGLPDRIIIASDLGEAQYLSGGQTFSADGETMRYGSSTIFMKDYDPEIDSIGGWESMLSHEIGHVIETTPQGEQALDQIEQLWTSSGNSEDFYNLGSMSFPDTMDTGGQTGAAGEILAYGIQGYMTDSRAFYDAAQGNPAMLQELAIISGLFSSTEGGAQSTQIYQIDSQTGEVTVTTVPLTEQTIDGQTYLLPDFSGTQGGEQGVEATPQVTQTPEATPAPQVATPTPQAAAPVTYEDAFNVVQNDNIAWSLYGIDSTAATGDPMTVGLVDLPALEWYINDPTTNTEQLQYIRTVLIINQGKFTPDLIPRINAMINTIDNRLNNPPLP